MRPVPWLLLALLVAAPAPLAAAQQVLPDCLGTIVFACDTAEGAPCDRAGATGHGAFLVVAPGAALVLHESCWGSGASREALAEAGGARVWWVDVSSTSGLHERRIGASAAGAHAEWRSASGTCGIEAGVSFVVRREPCLVGAPPAQPHAPWGRLLP